MSQIFSCLLSSTSLGPQPSTSHHAQRPPPQALGRIKKNTAYFRVNYLLVALTSCVVTFALHPSSLFVLGLLLGMWVYLLLIRQQPVVINGRQLRCVGARCCRPRVQPRPGW